MTFFLMPIEWYIAKWLERDILYIYSKVLLEYLAFKVLCGCIYTMLFVMAYDYEKDNFTAGGTRSYPVTQ